ncbi:MAG: Glycosyl transferase [Parcubacteria group bacterium Gr01-1014_29]|nr:MAG: Glycosyl transferase [Parcubacteria group bacterium Gr01-1014_29]
MQKKRAYSTILLACGDAIALYIALGITLLIRYQTHLAEPWEIHKLPFAVIFAVWLLIFFIAGLYQESVWNADRMVKERILRTITAAGITAVILFYLIPAFVITPKTNLLIHIALSVGLIIGWRMLASYILRNTSKTSVLFFGISEEVVSLARTLMQNLHLGYRVVTLVETEGSNTISPPGITILPFTNAISDMLKKENVSLVVTSKDIHSNKTFVRMLYNALPLGIRFIDFPTFYETMTGKIPVSLISEVWFLENVSEREKRIFETIKRSYDIVFSFFIGISALFFAPLIALAIKLETRGPVLIHQRRIGKNGVPFTLYKFRSMIVSGPNGLAEEIGNAQWAQEHDIRITRVGSFLRKTRFDELPQLINIFNGEMSFIGPRPERPEFIEMLKSELPFYDIRHLVRPGLSGWAQINFPYGASVEDAMQKLQYDLYYIKNRSIALDLNIALKTIWVILSREGR